jgi:hypothetical protein
MQGIHPDMQAHRDGIAYMVPAGKFLSLLCFFTRNERPVLNMVVKGTNLRYTYTMQQQRTTLKG